jgi:hypothetical protein
MINCNRKVRFRYDYNFEAGWQHEVVFEHVVPEKLEVEQVNSELRRLCSVLYAMEIQS